MVGMMFHGALTMNITNRKISRNGINSYPPKLRYKLKARRIKELENRLNQKKWQLLVKVYECGLIQLPLDN